MVIDRVSRPTPVPFSLPGGSARIVSWLDRVLRTHSAVTTLDGEFAAPTVREVLASSIDCLLLRRMNGGGPRSPWLLDGPSLWMRSHCPLVRWSHRAKIPGGSDGTHVRSQRRGRERWSWVRSRYRPREVVELTARRAGRAVNCSGKSWASVFVVTWAIAARSSSV